MMLHLVPLLALALAGPAAPADPSAFPLPAERLAGDEAAAFAADRAAILAMAGNYRVRFDMQETTAWREGYTPLERKISGGHEIVRVIEDSGRHIKLQHLLVVEIGGAPQVIKHWRQDWTYEPETVLTYAGPNRWSLETVPAAARRGAWSQTVWQTDDSPRYGGFGRWTREGGVPRWRSSWTWRPLARRDAVRQPVYDRYLSINRHSPTPGGGWIHWQDNIKLGPPSGAAPGAAPEPIVQEAVLNSYTRFSAYDVAAGERYWARTAAYWAAVRAAWDAAIARDKGVTVEEEANSGSVASAQLMDWANQIADGKLAEAQAIGDARALIAKVTGGA